MRNSNSTNQPNRQNKNRPRSGKNNDQGNRQRSQGPARNRQATEMWMDSKTLTSHIPQANRSNQQSNGRRNDSQNNGNGRNKNRNQNGPQKNRAANPRQDNQNRPRNDRNQSRPAQQTEPRAKTAPSNGDTASSAPSGKLVAGIEPFELFCAYHLGITREKGYKPSNINEVARRFNTEPASVKQALQEYDMDPGSLLDRDFDMALAQLDIQVAPEGVDRKELAKNIYEDFQNAPRAKRDWKKLLEEDRKENQKIFKD
ncbi:hypothetical protein ACTRW9_08955 [Nitrospina sp. 32_T5]|uniref:hypothetical protein n=1 Tax=unclassified Nitrospina TaxID=2638683 RepID=UPI003F9B89E9